jgi:hypothetical protein
MASRVVVLDSGRLLGLLKEERAREVLPQFKKVSKRLGKRMKGCNCSGRRNRVRDEMLTDLKTMIRGWSDADKSALKRLLKADEIRFFVGKQKVKI